MSSCRVALMLSPWIAPLRGSAPSFGSGVHWRRSALWFFCEYAWCEESLEQEGSLWFGADSDTPSRDQDSVYARGFVQRARWLRESRVEGCFDCARSSAVSGRGGEVPQGACGSQGFAKISRGLEELSGKSLSRHPFLMWLKLPMLAVQTLPRRFLRSGIS